MAPILQRKLRRAVGIDALKEPARAVGIDNYLSDVWSLPIYLLYDSTTILYYGTNVVATTTFTTTTANPSPNTTTRLVYPSYVVVMLRKSFLRSTHATNSLSEGIYMQYSQL